MDNPYDWEKEIHGEWEKDDGEFDWEFPEIFFSPKESPQNFLNSGFHQLIFNNPAYSMGELEELGWMGESLDMNNIGPIEGS